ncbi:MAG: hypothetical protein AB4352_10330 [Hormoscilla sp.]
MNTEERARELMVSDRQHAEHQHESMLSRAFKELDRGIEGNTEEEARELMATERQHAEHQHELMLGRASA